MFSKHNPDKYKQALEGIRMKTLAWGERTLMAEFLLDAGHVLPEHSHPYEQTGYLVSGRIRLRVGTETFEASPGDSWCIPMGVTHGADVIEDSVAVEVFSPVRQDYLPDRE
jgi:quercetin dioxygenase-like cupin family protein